MRYDPDIHHRRSIRLRGYDYAAGGAYYVTICVQGRECLFGDITAGEMHLNAAGRMVAEWWVKLPDKFPHVTVDEYVVMPNHFHGIIVIDNVGGAANGEGAGRGAACCAHSSNIPTLGNILRAFKSISAIEINRMLDRQGQPLWQRNYYERIVRDDEELAGIREYIRSNPAMWADDEEHPERA